MEADYDNDNDLEGLTWPLRRFSTRHSSAPNGTPSSRPISPPSAKRRQRHHPRKIFGTHAEYDNINAEAV
jgi:hypothetical protein